MSWDNVGPNHCHMDGTPIIRKIKGPLMTTDDTNDFGFTLVGEEDILVKAPVDLRAEKLRDMVMPLLNNMKKNPDKDYIQWPGKDRVKQIDAFIKKMNALVDG